MAVPKVRAPRSFSYTVYDMQNADVLSNSFSGMPMKSLQPPKSLVEQAYDTILDAICDGTLLPHERLTQDEIAARLAVSRQPVMSALALLRQQGFVIEHGRRGLAVAPIDRARFDAIYEVRSALEPLAARLATARMTPGLLAEGRAIVARGKKVAAAGDAKAALQADVDFHSFIYAASGNPLIVETMQLHWQHLRRGMGEVLRQPRFLQQVWREHAAILQAMGEGDAEHAAKLIGDHVGGAHREVREKLSGATATPAPPVSTRRSGTRVAGTP
jgi:DNA-binding GntR family transcriptional regulator